MTGGWSWCPGSPGSARPRWSRRSSSSPRGTRWLWGACDGLLTPTAAGPAVRHRRPARRGAGPPVPGRRAAGPAVRRVPGRARLARGLHRGGDRGPALGRRGDRRPAELPRAAAEPDADPAAGHLPGRRAGRRSPAAGGPGGPRHAARDAADAAAAAVEERRRGRWRRSTGRGPRTSCSGSPAATRSTSPRSSTPGGRRCRRRSATRSAPGWPGPAPATRRAVEAAAVIGARVDAAAAGLGRGRARPRPSRVPGHRDPGPRRDRPAVPARAGPDGGRGGDRAAPARPSCTPACWPGWRSAAAPTRRCSPTTPRAPATRRPCCGTRPEAARRSAALGAHREAAAQYERALRFADGLDRPDAGAPCTRALAGEYALLDRWEEAERALRTALALRRELGDDLQRRARTSACCPRRSGGCAAGSRIRARRPGGGPGPGGRCRPAAELAWAYANLGACGLSRGPAAASGHRRLIEKARGLGETPAPARRGQLRAERDRPAPGR